jgi:hypothetical protein
MHLSALCKQKLIPDILQFTKGKSTVFTGAVERCTQYSWLNQRLPRHKRSDYVLATDAVRP